MHDGLALRWGGGFGTGAASINVDGSDLSITGNGWNGYIAVGGAISPRWVILAESFSVTTSDATIEFDGQSVDGLAWGLTYLGLGGVHYWPSNFFLGVGAGAVWMGADFDDDEGTTWTDAGFGGKLTTGKEWWVSHDWGLGVAASLVVGRIPEADGAWGVAILGLQVSATYN